MSTTLPWYSLVDASFGTDSEETAGQGVWLHAAMAHGIASWHAVSQISHAPSRPCQRGNGMQVAVR